MNLGRNTPNVNSGVDRCAATQYCAKDFANNPIMISKDSQMIDVIEKLTELGISRLIVHDMGRPIGIVTTKDWVMLLLSGVNGKSVYKISLKEAMHKISYVRLDTSVKECAKTMLLKGISSLVVGNQEKIEGIFTKTDLIRYYSQNYTHDTLVSEYMRKKYFDIKSNEPLFKALERMQKFRTPRLVVIDENGNQCGMITMGDFFRSAFKIKGTATAEERIRTIEEIRKNLSNVSTIGEDKYVHEVMSEKIFSVKESDSLNHACEIMLERNIDSVTVYDSKNKLCGVLSKTDVMSALYGRMNVMKRTTSCSTAPSKNMKILIADDNGFTRKIYQDAFAKRGHQIITAEDGQSCFTKYKFEMVKSENRNMAPFDAVILDWNMPEMKGGEVAKGIFGYMPNQKIFVVSSKDKKSIQKEFDNLESPIEILQKGIPMEKLIAKVEN